MTIEENINCLLSVNADDNVQGFLDMASSCLIEITVSVINHDIAVFFIGI